MLPDRKPSEKLYQKGKFWFFILLIEHSVDGTPLLIYNELSNSTRNTN